MDHVGVGDRLERHQLRRVAREDLEALVQVFQVDRPGPRHVVGATLGLADHVANLGVGQRLRALLPRHPFRQSRDPLVGKHLRVRQLRGVQLQRGVSDVVPNHEVQPAVVLQDAAVELPLLALKLAQAGAPEGFPDQRVSALPLRRRLLDAGRRRPEARHRFGRPRSVLRRDLRQQERLEQRHVELLGLPCGQGARVDLAWTHRAREHPFRAQRLVDPRREHQAQRLLAIRAGEGLEFPRETRALGGQDSEVGVLGATGIPDQPQVGVGLLRRPPARAQLQPLREQAPGPQRRFRQPPANPARLPGLVEHLEAFDASLLESCTTQLAHHPTQSQGQRVGDDVGEQAPEIARSEAGLLPHHVRREQRAAGLQPHALRDERREEGRDGLAEIPLVEQVARGPPRTVQQIEDPAEQVAAELQRAGDPALAGALGVRGVKLPELVEAGAFAPPREPEEFFGGWHGLASGDGLK